MAGYCQRVPHDTASRKARMELLEIRKEGQKGEKMSGGSYNYTESTIRYTYEGHMKDPELEELLQDFCNLLHSLEWCDSGDTSESDYRADVKKFKDKWFRKSSERRKTIIEEEVGKLKNTLLLMIGMEESPCATCWLGVFNKDMSARCHWGKEPYSQECLEAKEKGRRGK